MKNWSGLLKVMKQNPLPSFSEGVKLGTWISDGLDYPTVSLASSSPVPLGEKQYDKSQLYSNTEYHEQEIFLFSIVWMAKYFVRNSCGCHNLVSNLYYHSGKLLAKGWWAWFFFLKVYKYEIIWDIFSGPDILWPCAIFPIQPPVLLYWQHLWIFLMFKQ